MVGLLIIALTGCELSPARDNPLDPDSPGYQEPLNTGRLSIRVLNLTEEPIVRAVVTLRTSPLQVIETDSAGWARFTSIPGGEWTIEANKPGGAGTTYSTISRRVSINAGIHYETVLRLNAQPAFASTSVNAIGIEEVTGESPVYRIYLKARVLDADGPAGISVTWNWTDTINDVSLNGVMDWSPDSMAYQKYIGSSDFPSNNIAAALGGTFTYEVRDPSGDPVKSNSLRLVRILQQIPYDLGSRRTSPPTLEWAYRYGDGRDFTANNQFDYGIRVFRPLAPFPDEMVFDTLLAPQPPPQPITNTLKLPIILAPGMYYWYVWVTDKFGNTIRSHKENLVVEGIPS